MTTTNKPRAVDKLPFPVRAYRAATPSSRAVCGTTLYGSTGARRIRTCLGCGAVCTSSAKYRETKRSLRFAERHESCLWDFIAENAQAVGLEALAAEVLP